MALVLSALNVLDTVVGGELRMTGKSDRTALDAPVSGQIEARGYELVNAPALASLLTVASFTGIVDLLNGDGIRFEEFLEAVQRVLVFAAGDGHPELSSKFRIAGAVFGNDWFFVPA